MIVNGKWLTAYDMADLIHEQEQKIADLETLLRDAQCVISRIAQGDCISCKLRQLDHISHWRLLRALTVQNSTPCSCGS